MLHGDPIKEIISQVGSIPSLPSLYQQVMAELASPEASIDTVGQIIARDPAMTAKVLQLVNSAFFGLRRHVSSPTDAAMLLGLQTIKTLVLWIHVFAHYREGRQTVPEFSLEALSNHSLSTGLLAREIVAAEGGDTHTQDEAMTAGLLHDIGKLVLSMNRPASYECALKLAAEKGIPFHRAEQELHGTSHAEVGAYLLGLWGLPFNIVEAVALHHHPSRCGSRRFSPLLAVHVANVLQGESQTVPGRVPRSALDLDWIAESRCADRLPIWRAMVAGDAPTA
jgi:putative nucleotidyltransferase with HDIG domain